MGKKKKEKKVNPRSKEYKKFSKIDEAGEEFESFSNCPSCSCCSGNRHLDKDKKEVINLCENCFFGLEEHKKLGKPKPSSLA